MFDEHTNMNFLVTQIRSVCLNVTLTPELEEYATNVFLYMNSVKLNVPFIIDYFRKEIAAGKSAEDIADTFAVCIMSRIHDETPSEVMNTFCRDRYVAAVISIAAWCRKVFDRFQIEDDIETQLSACQSSTPENISLSDEEAPLDVEINFSDSTRSWKKNKRKNYHTGKYYYPDIETPSKKPKKETKKLN